LGGILSAVQANLFAVRQEVKLIAEECLFDFTPQRGRIYLTILARRCTLWGIAGKDMTNISVN
jgi:acyl CoA:acetate/3-ketoacid CoA transferase beta subunit